MKKQISIVLAIGMLLSCLSGCGKAENTAAQTLEPTQENIQEAIRETMQETNQQTIQETTEPEPLTILNFGFTLEEIGFGDCNIYTDNLVLRLFKKFNTVPKDKFTDHEQYGNHKQFSGDNSVILSELRFEKGTKLFELLVKANPIEFVGASEHSGMVNITNRNDGNEHKINYALVDFHSPFATNKPFHDYLQILGLQDIMDRLEGTDKLEFAFQSNLGDGKFNYTSNAYECTYAFEFENESLLRFAVNSQTGMIREIVVARVADEEKHTAYLECKQIADALMPSVDAYLKEENYEALQKIVDDINGEEKAPILEEIANALITYASTMDESGSLPDNADTVQELSEKVYDKFYDLMREQAKREKAAADTILAELGK